MTENELRTENERLIAALKRRNAELGILQYWGSELAASVSVPQVSHAVVRGMSSLCADRTVVLYASPDPDRSLSPYATFPGELVATESIPLCAREFRAEDSTAWSPWVGQILRAHLGVSPLRVYPLVGRDPLGLLAVLESRDAGATVSDEILLEFVVRAGLALRNAMLHDQLTEMGIRDVLTGLYSRYYFQEQLAAEIARARRYGQSATVALIGVDDFRGHNARRGYDVGDSILRNIGRILTGSLRASDVAARYSGDQFALLLPNTPADGAVGKARQLQADVRAGVEGQQLTVSVGVAQYPTHALSGPELTCTAEQALVVAKESGGDTIRLGGSDP